MKTLLTQAETQRRLASVEQRLMSEFSDVPQWQVKQEVRVVSAALLGQARFTHYVPLLVYRWAREGLLDRRESVLVHIGAAA